MFVARRESRGSRAVLGTGIGKPGDNRTPSSRIRGEISREAILTYRPPPSTTTTMTTTAATSRCLVGECATSRGSAPRTLDTFFLLHPVRPPSGTSDPRTRNPPVARAPLRPYLRAPVPVPLPRAAREAQHRTQRMANPVHREDLSAMVLAGFPAHARERRGVFSLSLFLSQFYRRASLPAVPLEAFRCIMTYLSR